MEHAQLVSLGSIDRLVSAVEQRPVPAWDRRRHYSGGGARTAAYILVLDTVNFSFWASGSPDSRPSRTSGYWQLAQALRDAFESGDQLADARRLTRLEAADLASWVGDLPLLEERARALRELGDLVVSDFGGDFAALVGDSASGLAGFLSQRLSSYADFADYRGRRIPLLKRAQIAAADLVGAGAAHFDDIDCLTCFADYKLPQVLRHHGVLEYSDQLARRVDDWRELKAGEAAEVEIRAATVTAVEQICEQVAARGRDLRPFEVDWILWDLSQGLYPVRPHHRCRTIFY